MIIGTRDSRLALAQTGIFMEMMADVSDISMELKPVKTSGDMDQITELKDMGGYGAFVRELDNALLAGDIDVSVNSMKDMPVFRGKEITIGAVLPRASVEDVILPIKIKDLPQGAVVGSSSVRRNFILKSIRPDLDVVGLRGNIDTRLRKLDTGNYDAIILAKAGLERLGIRREMHTLSLDDFVPAPGQGAIAVACRSSDEMIIKELAKVDDKDTRIETEAERKIMSIMGGICSSPIGINAKKQRNGLRIRASYFDGVTIRKYDSVISAEYEISDLEGIAAILKGEDQ